MSLLCSASVCPSGQGVLFVFRDEAGVPANVASLADQREVHSLTLAPSAAGSPFTLTLAGRTTAAIAKRLAPPPAFFRWDFARAAGPYDLAVCLPEVAGDDGCSPRALYEVFSGPVLDPGSLLGTVTIDQTRLAGTNPAPFTDGTMRRDGAGPVSWYPIGRYTGSDFHVRVSAPDPRPASPATFVYASTVRVAPASGGVGSLVGPTVTDDSLVVSDPAYRTTYSSGYDPAGTSPHVAFVAMGAGGRIGLDPAAVQAALVALPGVGVGNLACSGDGTAAAPLLVRYLGTFGTASVPLISCSDPGIAPARAAAGDSWPSIRVNGGARIKLGTPYYGTGYGIAGDTTTRTSTPYLPFVYFPLIQPAPAVRREKIFAGLNYYANATGSGWLPSAAAGYSDIVQTSVGIGSNAFWKRPGLPAGTYRIAATWPLIAGNTTDAVFTATNRAGTTLATWHASQAVAPDGAVDDGVAWHVLGSVTLAGFVDDLTVTLTNAAAGTMVADGVRFERTSPDAGVRLAASDVVTYDAGIGWATVGNNIPAIITGTAPSVTGGPVANLVGQSIYPPFVDSAPRTMPLGWNIDNTFQTSPVLQYNNLARVWNPPGTVLAEDADGYPTRVSASPFSITLILGPLNGQGDGRSWPNIPEGDYTVFWDGASLLSLSDGIAAPEVASQSIVTGGVGNRRTFTLRRPPQGYGPQLFLQATTTGTIGPGNYSVDFRNLRVYAGRLATDPAGKFTPGILAKTRSAKSLRFLDPLHAIGGNNPAFADYEPPQSRLSRFVNQRLVHPAVAEVRAGSGFWRPDLGVIVRVTTVGPHGFAEGMNFSFPVSCGTIALSDGSSYESAGITGLVHVLSPTEFTFQFGPRATPPVAMTNILGNVGGSLLARAGNGMPLSDMIDLCNAANGGDGADIYINTAVTATDEALVGIGTMLGQRLKPGAKARVEYSNEVWNYGFDGYHWCTANTYAAGFGVGLAPFQCRESRRHWDLIRSGMAASGRGGDLVRVMGSQSTVPGVTLEIAATCRAAGIEFDELAIAPYINNGPSTGGNEPAMGPLVDLLTTEQDLDLHELFHIYSGYERFNPAHRGALDAQRFTGVRIVAYEGGPGGPSPYPEQGTRVPSRTGERSHAAHRHPRYYHLLLYILRQEQDSGMAGPYHFYQLATEGDQIQGDGAFAMWSAYIGTNQPAGTGDPALDVANVATPDRLDLIKSEVGGAFNRWMSKAIIPKPPARKGSIPGRNGMLRSTGYPRGAFRPTR